MKRQIEWVEITALIFQIRSEESYRSVTFFSLTYPVHKVYSSVRLLSIIFFVLYVYVYLYDLYL